MLLVKIKILLTSHGILNKSVAYVQGVSKHLRCVSFKCELTLKNNEKVWNENHVPCEWPECVFGLVLPFEVGDILVVALAADVDDLGEQLISVSGAFSFVHMQHELLHNLH